MQGRVRNSVVFLALLPCLALLTSCGAVERRIKGPEKGASTDKSAWQVSQQDPLAVPIQVGWTSARASYCGFVFNPGQLRQNFIAYEERQGGLQNEDQLAKLVQAYDYTRDSVTKSISDDPNYCNKSRTDAIRTDLQAYLKGDFAHRAKPAD